MENFSSCGRPRSTLARAFFSVDKCEERRELAAGWSVLSGAVGCCRVSWRTEGGLSTREEVLESRFKALVRSLHRAGATKVHLLPLPIH